MTKRLLKEFDLDEIIGLDFETFWAKDYTLKTMPTTEYVTDARFKVHGVSSSINGKSLAFDSPAGFRKFVAATNWKRTGILCHHSHFDGLILRHVFGCTPAFYFDTLSMVRAVKPVTVAGTLDAACKAFGLAGKRGGNVLLQTQGLRDLTPEQFRQMARYATNDIDQTWKLFKKLLPYFTMDELVVIDATVRMYAQPRLLINEKAVRKLYDDEVAAKALTVKQLKVTPEQLRSKAKFAALLRAAGVEPPMKEGKKGPTLAFSKTDLEFKRLLGHESKAVRDLVRGRLRLSSSILETRALRMAKRAPLGPQPIYLNYAGALTWRWSGGDKINWQNMTRGSALRSAIYAPKGFKLVIADSAQIEARLNACFAGQKNKVELFRQGVDVYAHTASDIYRRVITKETDPHERQLGKVGDLSLGYQSGPVRFTHTVRTDKQMPLDITDAEGEAVVRGWRVANSMIVANWKATKNLVYQAFGGKTRIEHGCVAYEGAGRHGYMHLPNGCSIRYCDLQFEDDGSISYVQKARGKAQKRKRLYGGLLVENRTQALARAILASNIVDIRKRLPYAQLVTTTHDELVYIVPNAQAKEALRVIKDVMTIPPMWMPDLPLGVDAHISQAYDK